MHEAVSQQIPVYIEMMLVTFKAKPQKCKLLLDPGVRGYEAGIIPGQPRHQIRPPIRLLHVQ